MIHWRTSILGTRGFSTGSTCEGSTPTILRCTSASNVWRVGLIGVRLSSPSCRTVSESTSDETARTFSLLLLWWEQWDEWIRSSKQIDLELSSEEDYILGSIVSGGKVVEGRKGEFAHVFSTGQAVKQKGPAHLSVGNRPQASQTGNWILRLHITNNCHCDKNYILYSRFATSSYHTNIRNHGDVWSKWNVIHGTSKWNAIHKTTIWKIHSKYEMS